MEKKDQLPEAERIVETFMLESGWYDFWHIHLDYWGQGNRSVEEHRKFISLYLKLLDRITEQAKSFDGPWQAWIIIGQNDSSQDCVYFHTPNPNTENYPYDFSEVNWNIDCPELVDSVIDKSKYQIGESQYEGVIFTIIKLR